MLQNWTRAVECFFSAEIDARCHSFYTCFFLHPSLSKITKTFVTFQKQLEDETFKLGHRLRQKVKCFTEKVAKTLMKKYTYFQINRTDGKESLVMSRVTKWNLFNV